MFSKQKWPTFEGVFTILIVVISVFSFAFFTSDNIAGMAVDNKITGNMVKVTGMATNSQSDMVYPIGTKIFPKGASSNGAYLKIISYNFQEKEYILKPYGYPVSETLSYSISFDDLNRDEQSFNFINVETNVPATKVPLPTTQGDSATIVTPIESIVPPPAPPGAPPSPQAPQPPAAPSAPLTEAPDPNNPDSANNIPIGGDSAKSTTGGFYYRGTDGIVKKWDDSTKTYSIVNFNYNFEGKIGDQTRQFKDISAPTEALAIKQLSGKGITNINRVTTPTTTPTTEYQKRTLTPQQIGGQTFWTDQFGKTYLLREGENQVQLNERIAKEDNAYIALQNIRKNNPGISEDAAKRILNIENADLAKAIGIEIKTVTPTEEEAKKVEAPQQLKNSQGNPINLWVYKGTLIDGSNEKAKAEAFREYKREVAKTQNLALSGFTNTPGGDDLFKGTDGKYYTINDQGTKTEYTSDTVYKKESAIGPNNQVPISVYDLKDGKTTFKYVYIEGINDIQFDKETLKKISEVGGVVGRGTGDGKVLEITKEGTLVRKIDLSTYQPNGMGTRIITDYENVYLNAQGNRVTSPDDTTTTVNVELRTIEEFAEGDIVVRNHILKEDEKIKGRVLKSYYSETLNVRNGRVEIEGTKIDIKTGKIEGFTLRVYDKNGTHKEITLDKDGNQVSGDDDSILSEAQRRFSLLKSRQFFAQFEFHLTQFKGLGGFSQLFFDEQTLSEWRENVDKIFSKMHLGTQYWTSTICSKHIPKGQSGLLTIKTRDGLFDVVAHVEGERTTIQNPNGTNEYIYKLTFSIRNPEGSPYDKLEFNVYLSGERTVNLYQEDIEVEEGDTISRGYGKREDGQVTYDEENGKPIVQYSPYLYNEICIKLATPIRDAESNPQSEICNSIVEYQGPSSDYTTSQTGTVSGSAGGAGINQEADF